MSIPHFHCLVASLAQGILVAESSPRPAPYLSIFWNRALLANSLTLYNTTVRADPEPVLTLY